jgi:hypothetical protein
MKKHRITPTNENDTPYIFDETGSSMCDVLMVVRSVIAANLLKGMRKRTKKFRNKLIIHGGSSKQNMNRPAQFCPVPYKRRHGLDDL